MTAVDLTGGGQAWFYAERRDRLARRAAQGMTVIECADAEGLSDTRIRQLARVYGIRFRRGHHPPKPPVIATLTPVDAQVVSELFRKGFSTHVIAQHFGLAEHVIYNLRART